jgi:hypothetical protein
MHMGGGLFAPRVWEKRRNDAKGTRVKLEPSHVGCYGVVLGTDLEKGIRIKITIRIRKVAAAEKGCLGLRKD